MARENKVALSSFKVNSHLAAFLEERKKTHPNGFTGIAEECLEMGAIIKGYEPPQEAAFERVLDNLERRLGDRLDRRIETAIARIARVKGDAE